MKARGAKCVLVDWGNTLMVDFAEYSGPMASWPRVEAVPHAREALEKLRAAGWMVALATNAADSDEKEIRAALARVELDALIDKVYCSRGVGHAKPFPAFFAFIEKDLGLAASELVMVGDNYIVDVQGANRCGIYGVWFLPEHEPLAPGPNWETIADLAELPDVLEAWRGKA